MADHIKLSSNISNIEEDIAHLSLNCVSGHTKIKKHDTKPAERIFIEKEVRSHEITELLPCSTSHSLVDRGVEENCDTGLSVKADAATLSEKLSYLEDEGLRRISSPRALMPTIQGESKSCDTCTGIDSGYISIASTPDRADDAFPTSQPEGPTLKFIDRPIPEDLKDRFHDFKIQYTRSLLDAVSKGKKNARIGDISMKLKYKSCVDDTAQLYIIVQCENRVAKRVKAFFAQQHIVRDLGSDFMVHILNKPLMRLLLGETVQVLAEEAKDRNTFCGMKVSMKVNNISNTATFGGLIMACHGIKRVLYGMTAAHVLEGVYVTLPDRASDSDSQSDEDDESVDIENLESASELEDNAASQSHYTVRSVMAPIGKVAYDSLHCRSASGNHDWALVDLDCEVYLPNLVPKHSNDEMEKYQPTAQAQHIQLATSENELFATINQPKITRKQNVIVVTSHGLQRGTLSRNDSSLMLAPGSMFVEMLDLLPSSDSVLKPGDSGSWVVNEATYEVYGHVVSIDTLGEAYVVPIQSTLLDIQTELHADNVSLPVRGASYQLVPDVYSHLTSAATSPQTLTLSPPEIRTIDQVVSSNGPAQIDISSNSYTSPSFSEADHLSQVLFSRNASSVTAPSSLPLEPLSPPSTYSPLLAPMSPIYFQSQITEAYPHFDPLSTTADISDQPWTTPSPALTSTPGNRHPDETKSWYHKFTDLLLNKGSKKGEGSSRNKKLKRRAMASRKPAAFPQLQAHEGKLQQNPLFSTQSSPDSGYASKIPSPFTECSETSSEDGR
ncbi:hypothetical protein QQS21_004137 [Conoideocrella luteorostrata]|uniref:Uncharacterized protein n=1 Tax=Conoideocrella luteorostrata TaxID=1105319 RepID=A0AAJ0CW34_9HYPO|nr:hypothetical protein QQS21_004137 [Conoideocrella luteorostrata]